MLCSEEFAVLQRNIKLLLLRETVIDQMAGDRCGLGKAHSSSDTMKNTCLCVYTSTKCRNHRGEIGRLDTKRQEQVPKTGQKRILKAQTS